jgi:pyrimidine operon attenuation protein/uracil phosphoribosyltransferase
MPFEVLVVLVRDSRLFVDTIDEPEIIKVDDVIILARHEFVSMQSEEKSARAVRVQTAVYLDK